MYLGFNGTNWFKVQTEEDAASIAIAAPEQGFVLRYRADKPALALNTELEKVIELKQVFDEVGKEFNIIFTANVDIPAAEMLDALNVLIEAGVNVVAVEADNEYYAGTQANFDFALYKAKFWPLRQLLYSYYPDIPFTIFIAPRPAEAGIRGGRKDHKQWNDEVKAYMDTEAYEGDGLSLHIYYGAREVPVMSQELPKVQYDPELDYPELDQYYHDMAESAINSDHLDLYLAYLDQNFPDIKIYVTEFGYNNAGGLKNTIGYSMGIYDFWLRAMTKFEAVCEHNGISPTNTGCITPVSAGDLIEGESNIKRLSYYTYWLVNELPKTFIDKLEGADYLVLDKDDSYFTFNKLENSAVSIFDIPDNKQFVQGYMVWIGGSGYNYYSSSGSAPYMLKTSTPSYEVFGIFESALYYDLDTNAAYAELPEAGFGYVYIELEDKPTEPCKRPWYCSIFPWIRRCKC